MKSGIRIRIKAFWIRHTLNFKRITEPSLKKYYLTIVTRMQRIKSWFLKKWIMQRLFQAPPESQLKLFLVYCKIEFWALKKISPLKNHFWQFLVNINIWIRLILFFITTTCVPQVLNVLYSKNGYENVENAHILLTFAKWTEKEVSMGLSHSTDFQATVFVISHSLLASCNGFLQF